jgi:hypothetical protein
MGEGGRAGGGLGRRKNYRGPGLNYVAHIFIFLGSTIICRLYKLSFSDQTKVSLSDLVY